MAKKNIPILVQNDPWLEPYTEDIKNRIGRYQDRIKHIKNKYKSLKKFGEAYRELGFNYDNKNKKWSYREWAPNAKQLSLTGDFNNWNRDAHPLKKNDDGVWEITLDGTEIKDGDKLKVHIVSSKGAMDRIPAYMNYVVQDPQSHDFAGCIWSPKKTFKWTDKDFRPDASKEQPYIYECHIGMALEKEGVGTYKEFQKQVLPRIHKQGYNTLQIMAVQEHPYYGSFGYHVSSFFAPSSRFGTPDDLKELVNAAHKLGMAVIMDLVHSHAVKNTAEGLNEFDGTDLYFHAGGKGFHSAWDSRLFNYGEEQVLRFLVSNVAYWIQEFHFDGYRYDGVTSMLYFHHGDHISFDHYDKYFNDVDWDVLTYLQLANDLIHDLKPGAITIAEDMSGMPGLCRPVKEGGMGFDFRLAMGIPDYWIKLLKHKGDEEWNMEELWHTVTNRRFGENTIAYAESHDQALVGDKSLAFWLMDKEMYEHMHVDHESLIIDRGIALHKMIRLITIASGGEGWLNFIGNEFGHPEWVDFPREGNNWSYKYARRQWSLADHPDLRYKYLNAFDESMVKMATENKVVSALPAKLLNMDQTNHTIIFERNNLIFAMNFSPTNSVPDYRFWVPEAGKYNIILNTDDSGFGGFGRVDNNLEYHSVEVMKENFVSVYLPSRVALVLKRMDT